MPQDTTSKSRLTSTQRPSARDVLFLWPIRAKPARGNVSSQFAIIVVCANDDRASSTPEVESTRFDFALPLPGPTARGEKLQAMFFGRFPQARETLSKLP